MASKQEMTGKKRKQPTLFSAFAPKQNRVPHLFCDLDGVLADFDAGVRALTGSHPSDLSNTGLWSAIGKSPNFYRTLPWTQDGLQLWEALRVTRNVSILTGVPLNKTAAADKFAWCKQELSAEVQWKNMAGPKRKHIRVNSDVRLRKRQENVITIITCWSRCKRCEARPGDVLIDDRESLRAEWEEAGGTFVHHTSAEKSLCELRDLGMLTRYPSAGHS